jgi:hypothetical protein
MSAWFRRAWLAFLLASLLTPSAGAQLLELPRPPDTEGEAQHQARKEPAPNAASEKQRAQKTAEPAEEWARKAPATPSEPPPSIARSWRTADERPEPAASPPVKPRPLLWLFLSLLVVGVVLFVAERTRGWITTRVALGRVLGVLVILLRLTAVGILIGIVLQLIPAGQDWILWGLLVLVVVVGWSVRDLFADLVAGGVLAAERRVKKGVWVSGEGFQGTVEGRTLRATWLRDGQGHRLTVPNRSMVGAPMIYDAGVDAEHEVVVRLEGYRDAGKVRLALTDAILSSPWVLAGANPVVLRDPADPVVWRVRTKLLEPRFSVHFEGELLERVEDLLRYEPAERETMPTDFPPDDEAARG